LFACTWTAVHPNIPNVNDGMFCITFDRLSFMMVALVAPEFMITWAVYQFFLARRAAKDFNEFFGESHNQFKQEETNMKQTI
jgi:hypothetical protein